MGFWQTVLLRHFVPFTHQLAVPWDNGRQPAAQKPSRGTTSQRRKLLEHNIKTLPLPLTAPKNATYSHWTLKVWHTTTGTSTISHPQPVLRHTLRDNPTLTHADA